MNELIKSQLTMTASEANEKANENMIPILEISMDRVRALFAMSQRYCNGEHQYSVPNGKFSDAEVELWAMFNEACWFKPQGK